MLSSPRWDGGGDSGGSFGHEILVGCAGMNIQPYSIRQGEVDESSPPSHPYQLLLPTSPCYSPCPRTTLPRSPPSSGSSCSSSGCTVCLPPRSSPTKASSGGAARRSETCEPPRTAPCRSLLLPLTYSLPPPPYLLPRRLVRPTPHAAATATTNPSQASSALPTARHASTSPTASRLGLSTSL